MSDKPGMDPDPLTAAVTVAAIAVIIAVVLFLLAYPVAS